MKNLAKNLFWLMLVMSEMGLTACQTVTTTDERHADKKNMEAAAKYNIQLGIAYLEKKDIDRAKQKFLFALEQAPKLPEAWYTMAYFQEATNNIVRADQYYQKAIALGKKNGEVHNNYGTFLCRQGRYQAAIEQFSVAAADQQYLSPASAYENAGLCALKIPNKVLAKNFFEKALAHDFRRTVARSILTQLA